VKQKAGEKGDEGAVVAVPKRPIVEKDEREAPKDNWTSYVLDVMISCAAMLSNGNRPIANGNSSADQRAQSHIVAHICGRQFDSDAIAKECNFPVLQSKTWQKHSLVLITGELL
jgi:hypothetical protein